MIIVPRDLRKKHACLSGHKMQFNGQTPGAILRACAVRLRPSEAGKPEVLVSPSFHKANAFASCG
jgi:hypothetical protein